MSDSEFINPMQCKQEEVLFDSGGTCDCYRLIKDNRVYCIKRPKKDMRSSEAYMNLFRKEFELGIELEHPNIVRYFAYDEDENGPFIRMDYIDGDNLEAFLAQHPGYFKEKSHRQQFCDELFSALAYLHEKKMLHLDLKPSNILITNKGHHVKLIDLGFGWSESYLHDLGFTRDYCSPEQKAAKTELFGPATDIYALGKILQRYGLAKDTAVQRCLKENPKERYQSIEALRKAIKQKETTQNLCRVGLGLAAVLLMGGLVWLASHKETPLPPRPEAPEGAINGLFTVNEEGKQVWFSQGNLQYKHHGRIWRFAKNQFDYNGEDNLNEYDVTDRKDHLTWVDLFGWGCSERNHGAVNWHAWDITVDVHDYDTCLYNAYGIDSCNLYDHDGQADWGYNPIINGGNEEGLWRTPSIEEWLYILDKRDTPSGIRYAKACVEGINGILLLPDDWDSALYPLKEYNDIEACFVENNIVQPAWSEKLEGNGAVFLPAAGIRNSFAIALYGDYGFYWSSSCCDDFKAYGIYFSNTYFTYPYATEKCCGRSVRLVRDKKE